MSVTAVLVRGCAVSRRYINVCNYDVFVVVNVMLSLISVMSPSSQRQLKTGVPQGGGLSPTLFNIYTADIPPPRAPVHVMAYADDITITSTHTSTSAAKKYIQPYLQFLPGQNKTISH